MKFLRLVNRFVSVLLVSVALTAALQFSGVASHTKDSADFEALAKAKMNQTSELIDGIFNVSWYSRPIRRVVRGAVVTALTAMWNYQAAKRLLCLARSQSPH